jgi:tetratricopeptide (TPR) repeat protein
MVQYGYISFCIAEDYKKEGRELLSAAYENLEKMETDYRGEADYLAIKASLAALELNLYPQKMMKLVPLALELTDKAYETDNNNYMALACKANMLNFTPRMFGGSPPDAIPLYKKIISLYESNIENPEKNWRFVSTMVTLAGTYEKLNMYEEACRVYEQIIEYDNNINWINTKLYPDCKANLLKQK